VIQVSAGATIYVAEHPVRFTTRLKGTLAVCRDLLAIEPMDGAYIVFRNVAGTMLRIVFYDGDGFWLCEKTFSKGRLGSWSETGLPLAQISARDLARAPMLKVSCRKETQPRAGSRKEK
jgi:transposase